MRRTCFFALVLACVGCGSAPPRPLVAYPGALRAPSEISGDFLMRQRVHAEGPSGGYDFDAVLQKQGDSLRLLVLGPGGARGFLIEQVGDEVTMTAYVPRELPFPPRYVMLDVHRTFFLGLASPQPDGTHTETRVDAELQEDWRAGRLLERRFVRTEAPAGTIRITYEGGWDPATTPPRVDYDNGWLGYRLVIETLSRQSL